MGLGEGSQVLWDWVEARVGMLAAHCPGGPVLPVAHPPPPSFPGSQRDPS